MTDSPSRENQPHRDSRNCLDRWLQEWRLYLALAEVPEDVDHPPPALTLDGATTPPPVAMGDIRLIHPSMEPTAVRYIAVLNRGSREWTVVPFGQFSAPAMEGEIRTDRCEPCLRVLCAWNVFTMSTVQLQRCWQVDHLTAAERGWLTSSPPISRIGPPLRHPLDPRWDYLEMESQFRQRITAVRTHEVNYEIPAPHELPLAAEDRAGYGDNAPEFDEGDAI